MSKEYRAQRSYITTSSTSSPYLGWRIFDRVTFGVFTTKSLERKARRKLGRQFLGPTGVVTDFLTVYDRRGRSAVAKLTQKGEQAMDRPENLMLVTLAD